MRRNDFKRRFAYCLDGSVQCDVNRMDMRYDLRGRRMVGKILNDVIMFQCITDDLNSF
jgi:hypothetical protein